MSDITPAVAPERRERTFFFAMAIAFAATIIAGFGSWAMLGHVHFPVPPHVHLHGVVFLTWIALVIAQTYLIRTDRHRLHRTLGWFAVAWAVVMIAVGLYTAVSAVEMNRVPPYFTAPIFLALSFMEVATFVVLLSAAILLRKRTAWHRRLMLGATVAIIGPAWGRILIMLGPIGGPAVMVPLLLYVVAAMVADLKLRGKIHPAYYWVLLALVVENVGTGLLSHTPLIIGLAQSLAAH